MVVREFKLINEKGQEYSLMDIYNHCLLTDPTGLGYGYSTEYEQLGNTFITNLRRIAQGQISGVANFLNYDNYRNFVDFIEKSEQLKFAYKIPYKDGSREFLKDVNIQSIEKSQIQTTNVLSETVVFDCLSLWYEQNTTIYDMKPRSDEINWDFKWDSKFANYDIRRLTYVNNGHVEAPIEVEISGYLENPVIDLYVEGELYQSLKFNIELQEYEKLLYGTRENNFYIKKQNTDGTLEDLYNLDVLQDFDKIDEVIRLPKNKSCEIRISADEEVLNAKVSIFTYYKAI